MRKNIYHLDPNFNRFLLYSGFIALAAGLSVGMGGLAAGYAIGIVGDYVSYIRLIYVNARIF